MFKVGKVMEAKETAYAITWKQKKGWHSGN
jgi:hypothetical protein